MFSGNSGTDGTFPLFSSRPFVIEIIDISLVARNDRDLIGAVSSPSTKTGLEAAPNPFSALFENLSRWFLKTLPASPLNPKTWREPPPKSLIPKDRKKGGRGEGRTTVHGDNLSRWFLKTLPTSPLNPKTWREPPSKSLIPKDREKGGRGSSSSSTR
jgi:hypothetical protein